MRTGMDGTNGGVPVQGQIVQVRNRHFLVKEVRRTELPSDPRDLPPFRAQTIPVGDTA